MENRTEIPDKRECSTEHIFSKDISLGLARKTTRLNSMTKSDTENAGAVQFMAMDNRPDNNTSR